MAPSDFHLNGPLKKFLAGKGCETDDQVQQVQSAPMGLCPDKYRDYVKKITCADVKYQLSLDMYE